MHSVKEAMTNEIIINKSKFISIIMPINNNNINEIIDNLKKEYKDATHYCYAYIFQNKEKCSDDGEPSGTAGLPILNVLKNHNLTNVLCIVIRYFGGIKLGAGGLIRAYSNSASEVLKKCQITSIIEGYKITIEFPYDNLKQIDYLLNEIEITKQFNSKIIYKFTLDKNAFNNLKKGLEKYAQIINIENTTINR